MLGNRDDAIQFTLIQEGGYSDAPGDAGGPTNFGVTLAALESFRSKPVTAADVQHLTKYEAEQLYARDYWDVMQCAALPSGIDLMVFDFGVNAGPSRSIRILQRIVGVPQDGLIGSQTLHAAACVPPVLWSRISDLAKVQDAYYYSLGLNQWTDGWIARTTRRRAAAMRLAMAATA